ncbi:homoserine dehydrogenase [Moorella thermoacetica Y72]|uniref:Homoserine dehydrogenase n=1 Tax=Moorella thermoacetica Y72 TaxID=1325331 RepID=A0A0S6UI36_NEOTH|nr:homoserine dehydrogenase [Moorella thermoacetica]GAF27088.1 homoserine dehydrogenase [Moorella thermoacetica Y72]
MLGPINLGLLGLGTVGSGVVRLLEQNKAIITQKLGQPLNIKRILVRDLNRPRQVAVDPALLTTDPETILGDPDIPIIVEVVGGTGTAREYILQALSRGKSVVTANKDLLALYGKELFDAADAHGADLLFEASVGGGIPIIRPLKECLAGNRIRQVMGIINGTTNYILTKMSREGRDFNDVLKEAQSLGYAEADPTSDIEGDDAARKMAILASIAFGTRITYPEVYREGIGRLSSHDINYARDMGYAVKLLGIAREDEDGIEVRVHPALVPLNHPLASVSDVFNAIFVEGDAVGETMFYGRGAGSLPTASAVVGDIIEGARNLQHHDRGRISCTCFYDKPLKPIGAIITKYYLRLVVVDRPGVLATIAGIFGEREVSLASVIQERMLGDLAELVLITHRVREKNVREALEVLGSLPVVKEIASVIRVEGGEAR